MDDNFDDIEELQTPEEIGEMPEEGGYQSSNIPQSMPSIPKSKISPVLEENPTKSNGQKAGNTISNLKNAKDNASNNLSKVEKGASNVAKAASKGGKVASKGMEAAGKGMQAAGKGIEAGSNAAGAALSAIPGVGTVLGAGVKGLGTAAGKTAETAGGALDKGSKVLDKASDVADKASKKLDESSKKHKKTLSKDNKTAGSKAVQATKKTIENTKKVVEAFKNPVKRAIIITVICLLLLIIIVGVMLEPLSDAMQKIKQGADYVEKLNNFIHGLGFENSKDAFYDELDFLENHYDNAVDEPLLMATLFYDDVFNSGNIAEIENSDSEESDRAFIDTMILSLIDYTAKEAFTEEDANGLVYTANKIYRLKRLTKNMVDKDGSDLVTVPLSQYIDINRNMISTDAKVFMKSFISVLFCELLMRLDFTIALSNTIIGVILNPYFSLGLSVATEQGYITPHDGADAIRNCLANAGIMFSDILDFMADIEGLELTLTISGYDALHFTFGETGDAESVALANSYISEISDSNGNFDPSLIDLDINITYSQYTYNQEKYLDYLKTDYIPKMPEFKDDITDDNGEIVEEKIDEVIVNIKSLAQAWEEIYGDPDGSGLYNDVCIGNIHPNIIDQFDTLPVKLEELTEVKFTTKSAFGVIYNGKKHNGVDLNEESVGVGVGTPVYAIFNGVVTESTASNDYDDTDKQGLGGWVKIQHNMTYVNDAGESINLNIYSVYGGLDPSSIPVTGTTVTGKQQIGVIGNATYAEDGKTPGLHFAILDSDDTKYLNPINIFITCSKYTDGISGICTYDESGGLVIDIPDPILQKRQTNYAVECYSKELGFGITRPNPPLEGTLVEDVYNLWVSKGARYKNGIAVLNVDGVDRYLAAMTRKMGQVGDIIDAKLENGDIIPVIIADIKSYCHTGVSNPEINSSNCDKNIAVEYCEKSTSDPACYGHFDGSLSVLEFDVDPNEYLHNPNGGNPSRWEQEWDTSQKVVSVTRRSSVLSDTVRTDENCQSRSSDSGDDLNVGELVNANGVINRRLNKFLEAKGSSVEEYQAAIDRAILRSGKGTGGYCTRNGSIAVAYTTIQFLADKGGRLPYYWGGEASGGIKEKWGAKSGVDPDGCSRKANGNHYDQCGLDCAGFVGWILKTAGYNVPEFDITSEYFGQDSEKLHSTFPGGVEYVDDTAALGPNERLRAGDILFTGGHIMFIVKVNSNSYSIAHAAGLNSGILFGEIGFNESKKGIRMENFYNYSANCTR